MSMAGELAFFEIGVAAPRRVVRSTTGCSAGASSLAPVYTGRVSVIGPDVYELDRDGNGNGCE
jgi:hypothetical protein